MNAEMTKVGIISCSGEAIPEGTVARLATRRVLELLRPGSTVTLCLPLFLAGNEGERKFAQTHPTLTVDGCSKQCAKWATERYSGPVSGALVVSDLLGTMGGDCHRSTRDLAPVDQEAVWTVAEQIATAVDHVGAGMAGLVPEGQGAPSSCGCSGPLPGGSLSVEGETVRVAGLPLLFALCAERDIPADAALGPKLLDLVKVYHEVTPRREAAYQEALVAAYRAYRRGPDPGL